MGGLYETISGARAARVEGKSARNIANYNAAVMEQEAKAQRAKAGFEQVRQAERAARIKSTLRARLAASGALPDVGTPLLLQEEQAAELELENLLIGYEGEVGARRAESQAILDRLQGRLAKLRGKNLARARNIALAKDIGTMVFLGGFGRGGGAPAPTYGAGVPIQYG